MSQKLLLFTGPDDQLAALTERLRSLGFRVDPSRRMVGGIHVRVRGDSGDEAEVKAMVDVVAPDAHHGPSGSPTRHIVDYREGR